jgi:cell division septation protein DedD
MPVAATGGDQFAVQLGAFALEANAQKLADAFTAKGYDVSIRRGRDHDGRLWYVLRTGAFASSAEAQAAMQRLKAVAPVRPLVVRQSPAAATPGSGA